VLEIAREKPQLKAEAQARALPPTKPIEMAKATTPSPARPANIKERYQESLQKTRIEGNISNRGRAGVNSVNTPMGRYHRRMCQQIESIWTLKTRERPELLSTSTVRMRYQVRANGTVTDVQVLDNGGDSRHAQICVEAIEALKLEPLPPEATPLLSNGVLEMALSFTLF
jgi:outer membrane biosynthesis protein TonB